MNISSYHQPEFQARLAEGIRLFNQRNFFEAHEIWEQEWKEAEGVGRIFYQGMIQAAVALHHIQRGNYAGAISVYLKALPKLANFPPVWMGIQLDQFRSELERYFISRRQAPAIRRGHHLPAGTRELSDSQQLPTIKWAAT
jgi:predicted metal-dependent hydrolase